MNHPIDIPDEYKSSFQRLVPYFPVAIREDTPALEAILLYLKVGGEKLARIAIEAYKQNRRLSNAEAQKRLREAALAVDLANQSQEDDETDDEEKDEVHDEDEDDY